MPVWVPELDMLYVLVPRTGSTAFRRYLQLRYDGIDLTTPQAIEAGLLRPDTSLTKHADLARVSAAFRSPVARRKIVKVAGVRDPADSLFSSWWKQRYSDTAQLEKIDELPPIRQVFLRSEAASERISKASELSFSDWVTDVCDWIMDSHALSSSPVGGLRRTVTSFSSWHFGRSGSGANQPRPTQDIWYGGADAYLRTEDFDADWERTCRDRGWSHRGPVPIFNKTEGRPPDYAPYLTDEAGAVVRRCFRRMIARFGYEIRSNASD